MLHPVRASAAILVFFVGLQPALAAVAPRVVTEPVRTDSDDPEIWVDPSDPARSLVLGTDKAADGALYAFDLRGRIVRRVGGLDIPNNVSIARGVRIGDAKVDLAIVTEAGAKRLRVFRMPDLAPLDGGGLPVLDGIRAPWGICIYRRPSDGATFVILSGVPGPPQNHLWQYRLEDNGRGRALLTKVREFGEFTGLEVEGMAVDDAAGYIYYSDERSGIRKYHADPDVPGADVELAEFGRTGFALDREGISIFPTGESTGYIIVSDQAGGKLRLFPREGSNGRRHDHPEIAAIDIAAVDSDGNDVTDAPLPGFPGGLVVAMSSDRTFQYYAWDDLVAAMGMP